jgi:hypothetical protein
MKRLIFVLSLFLSCSSHSKKVADSSIKPSYIQSTDAHSPLTCRTNVSTLELKVCRALIGNTVTSLPPSYNPHLPPNVMYSTVLVSTDYYTPYDAKTEKDKGKKTCIGECSSSGSGTVVGPGIVLTGKHVVDNVDRVTVILPFIDEYGVTQTTRHVLMNVVRTGMPDYAFLIVAHESELAYFLQAKPVQLAFGVPLPENATVWHFGRTTGPQKGVVLGHDAAPCTKIESRLPVDIKIDFGDSGGGIFYGETLFGYIMRLNSEVCQGNIESALRGIGMQFKDSKDTQSSTSQKGGQQ